MFTGIPRRQKKSRLGEETAFQNKYKSDESRAADAARVK
jgi:hypothetical protein